MSRTVGEPFAIGDVEIVPLIEQWTATFASGGRLAWHGERRPVGVVVRRGGVVRAYLIDGRECDAAALIGDFPTLAAWLR
jgi:hypothetical protein